MSKLAMLTLGVALTGLACSLPLVAVPESARRAWVRFPRHVLAGRILSTLAYAGAALALYDMPMGFLDAYKPVMAALTPVLIGLTWFYLDELLAARALGGLLLLIPAPWLDAARLHETSWSGVAALCAYIMVVKGMTLVVSPHLFRVVVERCFRTPARTRAIAMLHVTLCLVLTALAVTVYRSG